MDNILIRIQQYYDGDLSIEDRNIFESDLKTDSDLQAAVDEYKIMVQSVQKTGMIDVLNAVDLNDNSESKEGKSTLKWVGMILILASAMILIYTLSKGDVEPPAPSESPTIQYANLMPALDGLPVTLSDDGGTTSDAMIAYRMKDYSKAEQLFGSLINKGFRSDTIIIYQANVLIELLKYKEAIQLLSPLTLNTNSNYYYDALWFQAKSYLLNDQIDDAVQVLNLLNAVENQYQVKAKELIDQLDY